MLVHSFLENSTQECPEKVAVVHGQVKATYREIDGMADTLAARLYGMDLVVGDRVVILLENSLQYIITYYGTLKAGGVAVPLSRNLKNPGLEQILDEVEPRVIVTGRRAEPALLEIPFGEKPYEPVIILVDSARQWPNDAMVCEWDDIISSEPLTLLDIPVSEDNLASIIYTSGSTGIPKGVMLTHKNIAVNTDSICRSLSLTSDDVQMVVLPFFYVMGKSLLNTHFAVGGTVVLNNQFTYPATVVKQMAEEKVTGFSGVPSTFAYLVYRSPLARYRESIGSLRYCSQAGGHMARQLKWDLRTILPEHTDIYIMYGATEASARLSCLDPARFNEKVDSIGTPIANVTMKVLDENGNELPLGKTGELVAQGENIMQGYWKDPLLTAKVLDKNGYHTGDLGWKDEEGFFYLAGRRDNLLKVGGHRINPLEIEDCIMGSGFVVEVAVLGVADKMLGNRLIGLAVAKGLEVTDEAIFKFCAGALPRHKIPSEIRMVPTLPKKENGKIDRGSCKKIIEQNRE